MTVKDKIIELFKYRKLDVLLKKGHYSLDSELANKLIALQSAIYDLDMYLELNWKVTKTKLNQYWKGIHACLKDLGVAKSEYKDYLKHIRKYEAHELAMRKGKLPTSMSLSYYYFYKSCDVKLIRRIIYDYIPALKKEWSLSDWRQFDFVTEINDDIEDLYEDIDIVNGNYFLISLKENGKQKTQTAFTKYLDKMVEESEKRFAKKDSKSQKSLNSWSKSYGKKTMSLLKKRVKNVKLEELGD